VKVESVVSSSYGRSMSVVTPASAGYPDAQAAVDAAGLPAAPTGTGLYTLMSGMITAGLSAPAGGVAKTFLVVPFAAGGSKTYTLVVYGLKQIGTVWRAVCLYKGSCVCDIALTGAQDANTFGNSDKIASAITPAVTFPVNAAETTSLAAAAEPASVEIKSRGCPYVLFTASDAAARVAVCPLG